MQNKLNSFRLVLLLAIGGGGAFMQAQTAQTAGTPIAGTKHHHDPARESRELSKKLGLTAEQTAQIQPILADRQQKMQALMSNPPADRKAMHQQRQSIMQDTEQRLNAVLTDPQKQQFAALRAKHRHHKGDAPATTQTPSI